MRKALPILAACFIAASSLAATGRATAPPKPPRDMTVENAASCDLSTSPAATLLLPYFEVAIHDSVNDATNTIFSIINTVKTPQIARVTIWTDQGYPVVWFNVFLTGYDVQSISLYDVLARGAMPQTSSMAVPGPRAATNSANPHLQNVATCASSAENLEASALDDLHTVLTTCH